MGWFAGKIRKRHFLHLIICFAIKSSLHPILGQYQPSSYIFVLISAHYCKLPIPYSNTLYSLSPLYAYSPQSESIITLGLQLCGLLIYVLVHALQYINIHQYIIIYLYILIYSMVCQTLAWPKYIPIAPLPHYWVMQIDQAPSRVLFRGRLITSQLPATTRSFLREACALLCHVFVDPPRHKEQ